MTWSQLDALIRGSRPMAEGRPLPKGETGFATADQALAARQRFLAARRAAQEAHA